MSHSKEKTLCKSNKTNKQTNKPIILSPLSDSKDKGPHQHLCEQYKLGIMGNVIHRNTYCARRLVSEGVGQ